MRSPPPFFVPRAGHRFPANLATSDSAVLDHCARWCNAARAIIDGLSLPTLRVDLETPATAFSAD